MAVSPTKNPQAVFTTGNTMKHVVVMTATSSVGLVSIFFVDILNLYYISLLGQQELAAAIGYAATIMFFSFSVGIGVAIAAAALVGRALGANEAERARRLATNALFYTLIIMGLFAVLLFPALPWCLQLVGATGDTAARALSFMQIIVPSIPLLGLGMVMSALLRAKGDPKRAMYMTLFGGLSAAVLDPLLILGFDLGIEGAAIATFCTRIFIVALGYMGVQHIHKMLGPFSLKGAFGDASPFLTIALPAIATQLATPFGNTWVTRAIAEFGDDAVAGWAIIGRLIPVAFGAVFALSGAVGPIVSQNYGARLYPRITSTLRDAVIFTVIYCFIIWAIMFLFSSVIVELFNASDKAAALIGLFCTLVAGSFLFNGILMVANAAFNNLGFPILATIFNWGRATLGVIPFVSIGKNYGAEGVLIGWGLGAVVFGIAAIVTAFVVIKRLPLRDAAKATRPPAPPAVNSPFSSGKTTVVGLATQPDPEPD